MFSDSTGQSETTEGRLRRAVAGPLESWQELYSSFSPVDVATGERRRRVPPSFDEVRRAAVLVPLVMDPDGPKVVYTLRKDHLQDHAGQISFPGGGARAADGSLCNTALREASEEVDLPPSLVEVIGDLEEMYIPPSNFLVRPFVGLLPPEAKLTLAPEEVQEIFSVPLRNLLAPETFRRATLKRDGRRLEVPLFAVEAGGEERNIWGATAAMTANLLTRLGWSAPERKSSGPAGQR